VSPALEWAGVPDGAQELALLLEDPDAPGGTFTHWTVYGIEPSSTSLTAADGLLEGRNDFGDTGYGGPCPPGGEEHRYVFRLLALDAPVALEEGADRTAFDEAVAPRVLAEARLTATYGRP
jgi:Raf kinase inhibitor-like YbhB/YbcL family protein